MIIQYNCKFCVKPGGIEVADEETTEFVIEKWKPLLTCNRCADYLVKRRSVMAGVKDMATTLMRSRLTEKAATLLKVEAMAKDTFTHLTKRLASLVCDYYHKTNVWDQELVNMLMEKPDQFWKICSMYAKSIKTIGEYPLTTRN